ncbi:MAG TPA: hypothetical protein VMH02_07630 [Verrucomicrobiae bacterium]|nr:hypothetical protein [Verrucomicrobiae bacterium]
MEVTREIHFVVGFLVGLCALFFSWNSRGRRVMNVLLGIQVLIGLALAGSFGMSHVPLPPGIWGHVAFGLAGLVAYAFARRIGDRPGGGRAGLALSLIGLLCVAATLYVGWHAAGTP